MSERWKVWRRAVGVVLLGLACLSMLGWVRSLYLYESITLPIGSVYVGNMESSKGYFGCRFCAFDKPPKFEWSSMTDRELRLADQYLRDANLDTGFFRHSISSIRADGVSYWSVTLLLTLFTVYLLLGRYQSLGSRVCGEIARITPAESVAEATRQPEDE